MLFHGIAILTNHNAALGTALRRLREQRHFTLENLGFQSGLDRTGIALIELGRRSPTFNTIITLLRTMDVTFLELALLYEEEIEKSKENEREN